MMLQIGMVQMRCYLASLTYLSIMDVAYKCECEEVC